jgi:hypothetical protein
MVAHVKQAARLRQCQRESRHLIELLDQTSKELLPRRRLPAIRSWQVGRREQWTSTTGRSRHQRNLMPESAQLATGLMDTGVTRFG